jgi:hypothetical protein
MGHSAGRCASRWPLSSTRPISRNYLASRKFDRAANRNGRLFVPRRSIPGDLFQLLPAETEADQEGSEIHMSVEYRAIGQSPLPHLPAKLEDIGVGVISSLSRNCVRIGLFDHQSFNYALIDAARYTKAAITPLVEEFRARQSEQSPHPSSNACVSTRQYRT